MLKQVFFFIVIISIVPLHGLTKDGESKKPDKWTCVHSAQNYMHFERWSQTNSPEKVREIKIEMLSDCKLNSAYELLNNPLNLDLWMKGIKKVKLLNTESSGDNYVYTIFKFPWPFKNRDMVTLYTSDLNKGGYYVINIRSIRNKVPEAEKILRIKDYNAVWEISQITPNKTKIVFRIVCHQPPVLPRVIQDPIVRQIFKDNFIRLNELLLNQNELHMEKSL